MNLSELSTLLNSLHAKVRAAVSTHPSGATDADEGKTLFEKIDAIFSEAGADVPAPQPPPTTTGKTIGGISIDNPTGATPQPGEGADNSSGGDDPYNRPPYPSYQRFAAATGVTVSSLPFTTPAGTYHVQMESYMGVEVAVDGASIPTDPNARFQLTEGSHVATLKNDLQPLATTLQFVKV